MQAQTFLSRESKKDEDNERALLAAAANQTLEK